MAGNTVSLRFEVDNRQALRELGRVQGKLDDVDRTATRSGGRTSKILGVGLRGAAIGAGAAVGGFALAVRNGFQELSEAQKVTAQTNAVLKSTGSIAGVTAGEVTKLAEAISRKTGIDDEQIQASENLLLTFTNLRNEAGKNNDVFDQATQVAADLSVALGTDLNSASIQVGKALNDPIRGMTALRRVGISFNDAQTKTVEKLVEGGKTLEAQRLIMRELQKEVGGSAHAYGETLPGQLDKARNSFDELTGQLAEALLPAAESALGGVTDLLNELGRADSLEAKIDVVIGGAREAARTFLDRLDEFLTGTEARRRPIRLETGKIIEWEEIPAQEGFLEVLQKNAEQGARDTDWDAVGRELDVGLEDMFDSLDTASAGQRFTEKIRRDITGPGTSAFREAASEMVLPFGEGGLFNQIPDRIGVIGDRMEAAWQQPLEAIADHSRGEVRRIVHPFNRFQLEVLGIFRDTGRGALGEFGEFLGAARDDARTGVEAIGDRFVPLQARVDRVFVRTSERSLENLDSLRRGAVRLAGRATDGITDAFGALPGALGRVWDRVSLSASNAWQGIVRTIKTWVGRAIGPVNSVLGFLNLPKIPAPRITAGDEDVGAVGGRRGGLAHGGVVKPRPGGEKMTLAGHRVVVGEASREEVVMTTDRRHRERTLRLVDYVLGKIGAKAGRNLDRDLLPDRDLPRLAAGGVLQRALAEAQRIDRLDLRYQWGGGHVTPAPANGPFDCSSFVSRVLQASGLRIPTMTSGQFMSVGRPGRGALEVLANQGHVYMGIGGQFYGTSTGNPGGGPGRLPYGERSGFAVRSLVEPGGVVNAIQGFLGGLVEAINPADILRDRLPGIPEIAGPVGEMAKGALRYASDQLIEWAESKATSVFTGAGGGSSANIRLGEQMAARMGWKGPMWNALRELWMRESGWNEHADNPDSTAYGIPQALPGNKMAVAGRDWHDNPATQIRWGLGYVRGRYGNPMAALSHSDQFGWYGNGGVVPGRRGQPVIIGAHAGETVLPTHRADYRRTYNHQRSVTIENVHVTVRDDEARTRRVATHVRRGIERQLALARLG